jgi:hypothetical protein
MLSVQFLGFIQKGKNNTNDYMKIVKANTTQNYVKNL